VRQTVSVRHALADLNGDGIDDALVLLRDPDWWEASAVTSVLTMASASQVRAAPVVIE
jgi:hypothetical protein